MYHRPESPDIVRCPHCGRLTYAARYCVFCGGSLVDYEICFRIRVSASRSNLSESALREFSSIISLKMAQLRFLREHLREIEQDLLQRVRAGVPSISENVAKIFEVRARMKAYDRLIECYKSLPAAFG